MFYRIVAFLINVVIPVLLLLLLIVAGLWLAYFSNGAMGGY